MSESESSSVSYKSSSVCDLYLECEMAYEEYPSRVRMLQRQRFATLSDFERMLREFHYASFNTKAVRDRLRVEFAAVHGPAPFGAFERFPDDFFVHLAHPAIMCWTNQLMHSIDLPDRAMEKGRDNDYGVGDAKRSFDVAIDNLVRICSNLDVRELGENGIYCRETFETKFGMIWINGDGNENV